MPRRSAVAVLAFVALAAGAAAQTSTLPFLGRWKFNPAKSELQATRLTIAQAPSGEMSMTFQGLTSTFRIDGVERPSLMGSTAIWTQTGPRSWKTVYRMAKTDNNIDNYTLSEDGRTLTMKTDYLVPRKYEQTVVFTRASGGPGLPGVWQTKTVKTDSGLEMSSADGKTVRVSWPSFGGSATLTLDGREAPVTGPPTAVPPGMTASIKATGARTFDLVMKMNGSNLTSGRFTVAADGKTMTAETTSGAGASAERSKAVFDRQP